MHTNSEEMRVIEIEMVEEESIDIYSIWFKDSEVSRGISGQYLMVWNPGVDEIPMSISNISRNGLSSFTVKIVGDATIALSRLKSKEYIGIRGPFGNGFNIIGKNVLIVGGGSGVACLYPLTKALREKGSDITLINGAKSEKHLLFQKRFNELLGERQLIATEDGSIGFKGYASVYTSLIMNEREFDQVYTCGPELMMVAVYQEANKREIPVQLSLERYMKCAVGLCGSCAIGLYRVCQDGPIFDSGMLAKVIDEFGRSRLDPTGKAIKVEH